MKFHAIVLLNTTAPKGEELCGVWHYQNDEQKKLAKSEAYTGADFYSHTESPGEVFEVKDAVIKVKK